MEGIDLSQDPDMILHPDIIRIIDQDMTDSNLLDEEENPDIIKTIDRNMTDSNLLEEEENWIGVIDRDHIQDLHILHDA